jgi:hypothetical protein
MKKLFTAFLALCSISAMAAISEKYAEGYNFEPTVSSTEEKNLHYHLIKIVHLSSYVVKLFMLQN